MSVLDWFRRTEKPQNYTLKDPEVFGVPDSMVTGSGVTVTPDTALRISAVYGCVRILSETVASLPLHVYRRLPNGGRESVRHPLNNLLGVSGNGEQTAFEQREYQMSSLGLRGNAYSVLELDRRGLVSSIESLKPFYCHLGRSASGSLIVDYQEPGNSRVYRADQLWRVAALGSDGVQGLSPVALARENMALAITTEQSAARMFSNGNQTANVLEYEHQLTDEQIEKLRSQFTDQYSGYKNAHKPLILESGMSARSIGMSASDAQFLESRKFQIAEIARWYRVPLHMLAELDKATFSNIEHQSIEFVVHTIRPWLVRLEQSASRDLLTDAEKQRGLFLSHNVEGLLRGDTKARYEAYASGIVNGWMSRNEVRALENLNPVEGLDNYLVPLNMADASETVESLAVAENRILRKEAVKQSAEEFAQWLPGYYARQERRISDCFGVDAKGYGKARMLRLTEGDDIHQMIADSAKHTAGDIEDFIQ